MTRVSVFVLLVMSCSVRAQDMPLSLILIDGERWRVVAEGFKEIRGFAHGAISDEAKGLSRLHVKEGLVTLPREVKGLHGIAWGPDNTLYGCEPGKKQVVKMKLGDKDSLVAEGFEAEELVVTSKGIVYCSVPSAKEIVRIADGKKTVVASGEAYHGLVLWQDEGTLVAGPAEGKSLWAFRIEKDGSLSSKDAYYALRVAPGKKSVGVRSLTVDAAGRVYAATELGIQVYDPTGRMSGVLVPPSPQSPIPTALGFGGEKSDELFVAWGDKLYARKTKTKGLTHPR